MPACQLARLFKYIRAIGLADAVLWIDTLAVPIEVEYKRLAIMRLRTVYEQASAVLVVDRSLVRVGKHIVERQVQLLCSDWMRRLWTLQEGRLASRLYIQFRDDAMAVLGLADTDRDRSKEPDTHIFDDVKYDLGVTIFKHFVKRDHLTHQFTDLVDDMAHRSVTVRTDEPICLANMLGLVLENFKPYPTMLDIYRSLPILPPSLMFLTYPKMDVPGFRWAPSTFLEQEYNILAAGSDDNPAHITKDGLELRRECIMFREDLVFHPNRDEYLISIGKEVKYMFKEERSAVCAGPYQNAAIIFYDRVLDFSTYHYRVGAVVSDLVLREGVYYGKFGLLLRVEKWKGIDHHGDELVLTEEHNAVTFEGEFRSDVMFCVG